MRRSTYCCSAVPIWKLSKEYPKLRHGSWRVPFAALEEQNQKTLSHQPCIVQLCGSRQNYGFGLVSADEHYLTLTGVHATSRTAESLSEAKDSIAQIWCERVERALRFRQRVVQHPACDCFRLVNGASDGLPGIGLNLFGNTVVVETASSATRSEGLLTSLKSFVVDKLALRWYDMMEEEEEQNVDRRIAFTLNGIRYEYGHDKVDLESQQVRNVWQKLTANLAQCNSTKFQAQHQVLDVFSDAGSLSAISLGQGVRSVSIVNKHLQRNAGGELLSSNSLTWVREARTHHEKQKYWLLQESSVPGSSFIEQWQATKKSIAGYPTRYFPLVGLRIEDAHSMGLSHQDHRQAFQGVVETAINATSNDGFLVLSTEGKSSTQYCIEEIRSRANEAGRKVDIVRRLYPSMDYGTPIEDALTSQTNKVKQAILLRVGP